MEWFQLGSKYLKKILVYSFGLLFLAFGVAFSVNSNLGVSPVNSLPYIVSKILSVDMGRCVIVIFCSYIVLQILILRKNFKWINLTQIFFAIMFGYFVDLAKYLLGDFAIPTYFGQLLMLFISIVFVAMGVCLYMNAKLVSMPMEGLTQAVNTTFFPNKSFHDVKIIMDCTVVITGCILSFVFMGELVGIREGTFICAILVGKFMKPMQVYLVPLVEKVIAEKSNSVQMAKEDN